LYSEQKQALAAELSFKHPAVLAVSGSAGSGKTALLAALLPDFRFVEQHSLTEGMAEFLPIYKVLDKIPLVRNISNRIVVLQK
jgi:ABC-type phosphonate transport system ATPase subunit